MTTAPSIDAEAIEEIFETLDRDTILDMALSFNEIERQLKEDGPEDDDQLWLWVKLNLGISIPRVAVCEDHEAPFTFLADAYFHRYPAIIGMGNRGGGKTFLVALLHWLNSEFRPGIESATFGATENQSLRCYSHLKGWIYDNNGNRKSSIKSSVMRETVWNSGSKVEVLAGTPEAVNGPHPQIVHGDEVELMREDTWAESRNMAVSKTLPDGTVYPSQEILTSTRKSLQGRMQKLIDGIQEALKAGKIPSYRLVIWCIFEIAKEVPSCQMAPKEEREARLEKLGLDPCSLCECDKHMQGTWPEKDENGRPKPRLLTDVCKGRLFRSRGFMPYEDVVQKFKQNSKSVWEAQQECSKPETEHNYLQGYEEARHGIREYSADPLHGPIYMAVDWGGTNPHAVNWYQVLSNDIDVLDFYYDLTRLREGTIVCFDEIYLSEISIGRLATLVKEKEAKWRREYPEWTVAARFADPQGKAARADFKDNGLNTIWKTTRDFDVQVEWLLREIWEKDRLRVDIGACPMWSAEAQSWQRDSKNPDKQLDEFNHCMSNLRYATANIRSINRRSSKGTSAPRARGRHRTATVVRDTRNMVAGPVAMRERGTSDNWRARLGGPGFPNV